MTEAEEWNSQIIAEFRSNEGRVGGPFAGARLLLLHHTGAKTGIERVNPLGVQVLSNGARAVFASNAGSDSNPGWYYNLKANPGASIEVGTRTVQVVARVAEGEERDQIWERQKSAIPAFAEYETKTKRAIPVVVLDPA